MDPSPLDLCVAMLCLGMIGYQLLMLRKHGAKYRLWLLSFWALLLASVLTQLRLLQVVAGIQLIAGLVARRVWIREQLDEIKGLTEDYRQDLHGH